ncbi:hypothetical protein MXD63_16580 [Frankia sp. Cpl3]|nr:hypothetical protein [Frankia sp. Cpl3]
MEALTWPSSPAIYQEAARTEPDIARDSETIAANRERAFRRHLEGSVASSEGNRS